VTSSLFSFQNAVQSSRLLCRCRATTITLPIPTGGQTDTQPARLDLNETEIQSDWLARRSVPGDTVLGSNPRTRLKRPSLTAPRSRVGQCRLSGLRMMPTFLRSPHHSVRRVFPSTAGGCLLFRAASRTPLDPRGRSFPAASIHHTCPAMGACCPRACVFWLSWSPVALPRESAARSRRRASVI
jgi:hypothetical protein